MKLDAILVIWLALASVGILVHTRGVKATLKDLKFVRGLGLSHVHIIMVRGRVRHESMRLCVQAIFLSIGIRTAFPDLHFPAWLVGILFLIAQSVLVLNSILDHRNRGTVNRMLADAERAWDGRERRQGERRQTERRNDERSSRGDTT